MKKNNLQFMDYLFVANKDGELVMGIYERDTTDTGTKLKGAGYSNPVDLLNDEKCEGLKDCMVLDIKEKTIYTRE